MRNTMITVAAASIPLLLSASGAFGREPDFPVPATDRAEHTQPLPSRAAGAQDADNRRDWSASIGNGHTTSTTDTALTSLTSGGPSASPHWSASIGNGQVKGESIHPLQVVSSVTLVRAPQAHWTSKIGTAHAADSDTSMQNGKAPS